MIELSFHPRKQIRFVVKHCATVPTTAWWSKYFKMTHRGKIYNQPVSRFSSSNEMADQWHIPNAILIRQVRYNEIEIWTTRTRNRKSFEKSSSPSPYNFTSNRDCSTHVQTFFETPSWLWDFKIDQISFVWVRVTNYPCCILASPVNQRNPNNMNVWPYKKKLETDVLNLVCLLTHKFITKNLKYSEQATCRKKHTTYKMTTCK